MPYPGFGLLFHAVAPSCQLARIEVAVVTEEVTNLNARLAGKHCSTVMLPVIEPVEPIGPTCAVLLVGVNLQTKSIELPVAKVPTLTKSTCVIFKTSALVTPAAFSIVKFAISPFKISPLGIV